MENEDLHSVWWWCRVEVPPVAPSYQKKKVKIYNNDCECVEFGLKAEVKYQHEYSPLLLPVSVSSLCLFPLLLPHC